MKAIDANVILRYLTNDVPSQAAQAEELFKKLESGSEDVWLPDIILADIIWILEGYYKQPRGKNQDWITTILSLPGMNFSNKTIALTALDIYVTKNIDWSDAFTASQLVDRGIVEIYSFDRHFDRIPVLTRSEP